MKNTIDQSNKTIVVIPHRNDYPHVDLIYCLRSLEKNLIDLDKIVIVGDLPRIIQGVEHIPAQDSSGYQWAARNIYRKLKTAAERYDRFLVVHDDHFLLHPVKGAEFPYYHRGPINAFAKSYGYEMLLTNTRERFIGAKDFDVHCPILMTKEGLSKLDSLDWEKPYGYGVKTSYCHMNGIEGEMFDNLKIKTPMGKDEILHRITGRMVFSTGSGAYTGEMERALKSLFPKPSRFEITKHLV